MPKSGGGGGGGGGRGFRSSGARAPRRNAPNPVSQSPPPAPRQDDNKPSMGGFGAAIADGFGFGYGSEIGHMAVDAVVGPPVVRHETVAAPAAANTGSYGDACGGQAKAFQDCVINSESDISKCQFYMDMLRECQGVKEPSAVF